MVRYRPHPGLRMEDRARTKLHETTGKSFEQWVRLATKSGITELSGLREWLIAEHDVGSRNSWWIAEAALHGDQPTYDEPMALVDALYAGARAALRPLHERLIDEFLALGDDVLVTACKTMVPVYRKFVFAELRPLRRRIEIRLARGTSDLGARLVHKTRTGGDRLDCALEIEHEDEIDAELRGYLANAYEAGAEKATRAAAHEPPADLVRGLAKSKPAAKTWATCTAAMQRDIVEWITSAKLEATQQKRTAIALEKLAAGKRKIY